MKKILAIIITVTTLLSVCTGVSAHNIGDVINYTTHTDIAAKINGFDIASYNINGYTAVVAEDLRNYGFEVIWDPVNKSLNITKNSNDRSINNVYIFKKPQKNLLGKKACKILYTDIKTYINGSLVESYNINGQTIIYFNDLGQFGQLSYDDSIREMSLMIEDLPNNSPYTYDGTRIPTYTRITGIPVQKAIQGLYEYKITTKDDFKKYVNFLDETGWEVLKTKSGEDYYDIFFEREMYNREVILISIRASYGQIWIFF